MLDILKRDEKRFDLPLRILVFVNVLIPFLFVWIRPGFSGAEYDAMDYRLPLIQWALRHKAYPNFLWTYVDDYPALAEVLMAPLYLLTEWGLRIVSAAGYGLFVWGAIRLGKMLLPRSWALLGALTVVTMSLITTQDNLLMIDVFAGALTLCSIVYLSKCWSSGIFQTRSVVKAGLFAGAALATRYTQIAPVGILGFLVLIIPMRAGFGGRVKACLIFGVTALAVFAPWLIRNWVINGNPLYPLFTPILGGVFFDAKRHHEVFTMVGGYGFGSSLKDFLLLPFRFAFYGGAFDYYIGPQLLGFLPWAGIFLIHRLRDPQVSLSQRVRGTFPIILAFALLVGWFVTSRHGRFLVHVVPVGVFAALSGMLIWFSRNQSGAIFRRLVFLLLLTVATLNTAKHFKKHYGEWNQDQVHQREVAMWARANLKDGKLLVRERLGNLAAFDMDFVYVYPHVYSTSLYDYRNYGSLASYYEDLYREGVRYYYSTEQGRPGVAPMGLPIDETGSFSWNLIYAAPNGGSIYALAKQH